MEPQLIRRSHFAKLRGVSPARVSQWIAKGLIHGALVGDGQTALINAPVAIEQLRASLDVSQRFGLNGISTRLDDAAAPPVFIRYEPPPSHSVEAQFKAEKLRHAQLMTGRLEEEDRLRRGLYVEAAAARAEMARIATDLLMAFEGALPDLADALDAEFRIPARDALHLMRKEFRRARERLGAAHAAAAAAEPRTTRPLRTSQARFSEKSNRDADRRRSHRGRITVQGKSSAGRKLPRGERRRTRRAVEKGRGMSFRFYRRVSLIPGLRLNASRSGFQGSANSDDIVWEACSLALSGPPFA